MKSSLVSVIIPTYNRAGTLSRTIDSVLAQSYQPLEIIVVDDGSTDDTHDVLERYGDRIRLICRSNGGPSMARNTGAGVATGEFIAFLDSDDIWLPDKISRQVQIMIGGGTCVPCCICNAALIDKSRFITTSFAVSDVITGMQEGFWMNPAPILATRFILFNQVALIRREAFDRVGGYKPELRLLEDYDLACHLSLLGPWAFISDTLVEKYNDTKGIGVMAMRDPQAHSHAWQAVLAKFLKPATDHDPGVGMLVRRALTDVKSEIQAVNMLRGNDVLGRIMAQALIFCRQKRQSLRRRLPGWPRVLPLGVLPYDSGAGRSVVDYTEQASSKP